ncbi:MAG: hypothetical protein GY946_18950 [bacterium]|nr:hypothetical protein [bacterium]
MDGDHRTDDGDPHGYFQIRLRVIPTEEGGRSRPIPTGFRTAWDIGNAHAGRRGFNDARLVWENGAEFIELGTTAVARIYPLVEHYWQQVETGMRIYAYEGSRCIAEAVVTGRIAGSCG